MLEVVLFLAVFLGNSWIWRIYNSNISIFILIVLATIYSFLVYEKKSKFATFGLIAVLVPLFYFQFITTVPQSLTILENDELGVKQQRLKLYNSVGTSNAIYNPFSPYLRILFHRVDLKNFLEGDLGTISTRIQRNFFESIDPNIYFFAGHPRERVWVKDFEKFYFLLCIPFFVGLHQIFFKRNYVLIIYLGLSLILLSLIGHKNSFGPFILFPGIVLVILKGLMRIKNYVR